MDFSHLKGLPEMMANIRKFASLYPDRVLSAMYIEAQIEMTESKRRCPVWNPDNPVPRGVVPGELRASGTVHDPVRQGRTLRVDMSYGTSYAVYVHENPDAFHAIGQWKYLESVLNESQPHIGARIAARVSNR